MERWPVDRTWLLVDNTGNRSYVPTSQLREHRACVLLGAAGLGKTFELKYLSEVERQHGVDVHADRLAVLGQTTDGLADRLDALAERATPETAFYLDALDEVMIPVKRTALIVERWIRDRLTDVRPALRLSCRSAVWPRGVEGAIRDVYGDDHVFAVAILQALTLDDVRSVAVARGIDANHFLSAIGAAGAEVLAQHPLTLEMLCRVYLAHDALPAKRKDLFGTAVRVLASDRTERVEVGTALDLPVEQILEAAERLACYCMLSGRDTIDLGDDPSASALGRLELADLPASGPALDVESLRAIGRTGLCDGDGPHRFRFAHRQFAEYLAGRRLAQLLLHQSQSLLATHAGPAAGVAGPLRETAAFAAMHSDGVAAWVSEHDPEVVGLSDVADPSLRRRAALNLLDLFRRRELADSQIGRDGIELAGFQYDDAERDLRPILRERETESEDVLECAIEMIESWNLASMSDDLANVMLDDNEPLHPRKSAGYALLRIGTPEAQRRTLSLLAGGEDDPDLDLKGLALRCNWPDRLTVPRLLEVLTPPKRRNYHGAYDGFLFQLDREGFDAAGHRVEGLLWARRLIRRRGDYDPTVRIAKRIASASLTDTEDPAIREALADLMLAAAAVHAGSPLAPIRGIGLEDGPDDTPTPTLALRPDLRRALIGALTERAQRDQDLWWTARETPGLLSLDDFPWLLANAADETMPMAQRAHYAELARMMAWQADSACVDAWLQVREVEPVASRLPVPLSMTLGSEEAQQAKEAHADMKRWDEPETPKRIHPAPAQRVERAIELAETNDPVFFLNLCAELTLEETSESYGFDRFISRSPGWGSASPVTRRRVVEAAKRLLVSETDEPERVQSVPLNTILSGYMHAVWLLMEVDRAWLESRPPQWWRRWAWYFLRELHPNMIGEPDGPKQGLLRMLHARAPDQVRNTLAELAASDTAETRALLTSLFGTMDSIVDAEADALLTEQLETGRVAEDRVGPVARFVLSRNSGRAVTACLSRLEPEAIARSESAAVSAAIVLLHERTAECWTQVFELIRRRPDLAARILGGFAHSHAFMSPDEDEARPLENLRPGQLGQLAILLMETYPPSSDPDRGDGAHSVGPDDSAREIRNRLISFLGHRTDIEAVEALRSLEHRFGAEYTWLRRPRARAERAHRLSQWTPIPPTAVAEILSASDKALIRSERDALDGIETALQQYAHRLRHDSPSDLEDLWNIPRGAPATPKEEERVSDKLCVAIREYFRQHSVAAEREVQISRRKLARKLDGVPGSEVDIFCRVLPAGSTMGDTIAVPIEVKLAHNPEARTGLRNQLVDRYMSEVGTSLGVFVVAWMGGPNSDNAFRSLWGSPEEAREELEAQARVLMSSAVEPLDIRVVVVDASLPTVSAR